MNVWDEILIAFGGNAMLLVVLGFLARSLLQTWLAKDIKRFETDLKATADSELERLKADLKSKGDVSIEQLKSYLQQTAFEHQVRFSNLHEKRAEIIADLYGQAVEVQSVGEKFVFQVGAQEHQEHYLAAHKTIVDFYKLFQKHRIYLPQPVCKSLATFIDAIRQPVIAVYVYGDIDYPNPQTLKERNDAFMKAYQAFQKDIPAALNSLEDEFRTILGVEKSRPIG